MSSWVGLRFGHGRPWDPAVFSVKRGPRLEDKGAGGKESGSTLLLRVGWTDQKLGTARDGGWVHRPDPWLHQEP